MSFRDRAREWVQDFNEAAAARHEKLRNSGIVESILNDGTLDHTVTPAYGTPAIKGFEIDQQDQQVHFYDAEAEGWIDSDNEE